MPNSLPALQRKLLVLWGTKELRSLFQKSPEFVEAFMDFATAPNVGTPELLTLYFELGPFIDEFCVYKNGRIKPSPIGDLAGGVMYEMLVRYTMVKNPYL